MCNMRESKNAYQACFDVAKRLGFGRGVLFYHEWTENNMEVHG